MMSLALFTAMAFAQRTPIEIPAFKREFRGVWVATVANIDWPSKRGISTDQAQREMVAILEKAKALGLNAVVWQVRPSCDALYDSKLEPWSEYLTGRQGKAPDPYWDPLAYGIREAHKRGLEFHCWFNPYRAYHPSQLTPNTMQHVSNAKPSIVKKYGKYLWLDPGEKETQKHSLDVMLDVVKRYDVDGIHIDDYFYPYKEKDSNGNLVDFPDDSSYGRYRAAGGKLNRGDWRRANVDTFVHDLYSAIKHEKKWVKFGISPFGIYRPGVPPTIKAGVDQYTELYADCLKWFQNGWLDYFTPQLYWKMSGPQAYPTLLEWWASQNAMKRHLWPGNYTSRTDAAEMEGGATWPPQEIINQVEATRDQGGATGNVHFSMRALMHNAAGIADSLKKEYAEPALVPASPWLGSKTPRAPNIKAAPGSGAGRRAFLWSPGGGDELQWICVYSKSPNGWRKAVLSADETLIDVPGTPNVVAVSVVDRYGNESPRALWPPNYEEAKRQ